MSSQLEHFIHNENQQYEDDGKHFKCLNISQADHSTVRSLTKRKQIDKAETVCLFNFVIGA